MKNKGVKMSELKHTPGPWAITRTITDKQNGGEFLEIKGNDKKVWIGDIRRTGDARLIASAPELLDAGNKFIRLDVNDKEELKKVRELAWKAINKAESTK
ncbi:MAG: hypothetical protein GY861_14565 [bacterium]|nr:hypothetical protein [bacterium]